jgi:DNA polymerase-4
MISPTRKIIHIDMDCFYAAVEVKHHPELRGKPLGVGGPASSRGVLCTASYEARKFGVRSAMATAQALRLCPGLILVPPNFSLYKQESAAVQNIFRRFTNEVEPLSLDEAYLDVTASNAFGGSATHIAREIRRLIQSETGLTASAGVAPNKFLAKVASDWKKPNGLFVIPPDKIAAFVSQLEVGRLPGIGKVTQQKLTNHGLHTCADLQRQGLENLQNAFGNRGEEWWELAHGRDARPVQSSWERLSLTVEETFPKDLRSLDDFVGRILPALYDDWKRRMDRYEHPDRIAGYKVKVKYFDFQTRTQEKAGRGYPSPQNFEDLFRQLWSRRSEPLRLAGLGVRLNRPETLPYQIKFPFY